MKMLQLDQMTRIVKNRMILLCQNGFLKNETQINAFALMLSAIHFSPKHEHLNPKIAEQNIERDQVELINNAIDLFPNGERFLIFFKFYSGSGNVNLVKPRNVWNVIRAINDKEIKNFSKIYANVSMQKGKSSKPNKHKYNKIKRQNDKVVAWLSEKKTNKRSLLRLLLLIL